MRLGLIADGSATATRRTCCWGESEVVRFDPAELGPVRTALRQSSPRHVALVMRPEQTEFDFSRRFLQMSTEIDDDPFVDCAFGYITGRSPATALAFAQRCVSG